MQCIYITVYVLVGFISHKNLNAVCVEHKVSQVKLKSPLEMCCGTKTTCTEKGSRYYEWAYFLLFLSRSAQREKYVQNSRYNVNNVNEFIN